VLNPNDWANVFLGDVPYATALALEDQFVWPAPRWALFAGGNTTGNSPIVGSGPGVSGLGVGNGGVLGMTGSGSLSANGSGGLVVGKLRPPGTSDGTTPSSAMSTGHPHLTVSGRGLSDVGKVVG
jgi:hypothetical protein